MKIIQQIEKAVKDGLIKATTETFHNSKTKIIRAYIKTEEYVYVVNLQGAAYKYTRINGNIGDYVNRVEKGEIIKDIELSMPK